MGDPSHPFSDIAACSSIADSVIVFFGIRVGRGYRFTDCAFDQMIEISNDPNLGLLEIIEKFENAVSLENKGIELPSIIMLW